MMTWSIAWQHAGRVRRGGHESWAEGAVCGAAREALSAVDGAAGCLHREVEGHELDDRPQLLVRRAGGEPGEACFRDRRVDHALLAKLLEQALGDLWVVGFGCG